MADRFYKIHVRLGIEEFATEYGTFGTTLSSSDFNVPMGTNGLSEVAKEVRRQLDSMAMGLALTGVAPMLPAEPRILTAGAIAGTMGSYLDSVQSDSPNESVESQDL